MATKICGDDSVAIFQKPSSSSPTSGTTVYKVAADDASYDGVGWGTNLGVINFNDANQGRVRFSTKVSGDDVPAGATILSATLRLTGGMIDSATRQLFIDAFTTSSALSAYAGTYTAATSPRPVNFLDDGTEKSITILPAAIEAQNDFPNALCCLRFLTEEFQNDTICTDLDLSALADMYLDLEWEL